MQTRWQRALVYYVNRITRNNIKYGLSITLSHTHQHSHTLIPLSSFLIFNRTERELLQTVSCVHCVHRNSNDTCIPNKHFSLRFAVCRVRRGQHFYLPLSASHSLIAMFVFASFNFSCSNKIYFTYSFGKCNDMMIKLNSFGVRT